MAKPNTIKERSIKTEVNVISAERDNDGEILSSENPRNRAIMPKIAKITAGTKLR